MAPRSEIVAAASAAAAVAVTFASWEVIKDAVVLVTRFEALSFEISSNFEVD